MDAIQGAFKYYFRKRKEMDYKRILKEEVQTSAEVLRAGADVSRVGRRYVQNVAKSYGFACRYLGYLQQHSGNS